MYRRGSFVTCLKFERVVPSFRWGMCQCGPIPPPPPPKSLSAKVAHMGCIGSGSAGIHASLLVSPEKEQNQEVKPTSQGFPCTVGILTVEVEKACQAHHWRTQKKGLDSQGSQRVPERSVCKSCLLRVSRERRMIRVLWLRMAEQKLRCWET